MKRSVLFLLSFFSFLYVYGQKASIHGADVSASDTLGITSFNIRYGEANDGVNSWPNRKSLIKNYVQSTRPDILGVQEALIGQIAYLDSIPGYEFVGVGRDNGMTEGEYCAIFYNDDELDVRESGTFWLSETPGVPTKGWDGACPRICTWAKFKNKNGKEFCVFNTHLDHMGRKARMEGARLIISKINLLNPRIPVFLIGDFNATSEDLPIRIISDFLSDSREISQFPDTTDGFTFNGFKEEGQATERIDYIFVNNFVRVISFHTNQLRPDNKYLSDHYPIEGTFIY